MTGFIIYPATVDNVADLARIHIQGWRDSGTGVVDPVYLNSLGSANEAEVTEKWPNWLQDPQSLVLLAHDAQGTAAGFVYCGRLRTPIPGQSPIRPVYSGEIYALYILPSYWRQGLGRKLVQEAAVGLAAQRHKSFCLWVLEGNRRAIAFYETLGGQRCGKKDIEIGNGHYKEVCFGWRNVDPLRFPDSGAAGK
jgi:GNAT superfamily N-acetyltransferase